jgi:3-dehydrosphinganine reductase
MAVNYFGAAQCARAVVASMKGRREGGIVFVSSQAGLSGIYGFAAYSASKFALRGLAEALAMEVIYRRLLIILFHYTNERFVFS